MFRCCMMHRCKPSNSEPTRTLTAALVAIIGSYVAAMPGAPRPLHGPTRIRPSSGPRLTRHPKCVLVAPSIATQPARTCHQKPEIPARAGRACNEHPGGPPPQIAPCGAPVSLTHRERREKGGVGSQLEQTGRGSQLAQTGRGIPPRGGIPTRGVTKWDVHGQRITAECQYMGTCCTRAESASSSAK